MLNYRLIVFHLGAFYGDFPVGSVPFSEAVPDGACFMVPAFINKQKPYWFCRKDSTTTPINSSDVPKEFLAHVLLLT